jgi:hypothetical protein
MSTPLECKAKQKKTTVVNRRRIKRYDVYVGRPTKWGNPFEIGKPDVDGTPMSRKRVIARYRAWLLQNKELLSQVKELKGKVLACWCAPLPCHADVLASLADAIV